jgi:alpha-tubulin suppressor-like RCC1 family protein
MESNVWSFGSNTYGQLGFGDFQNRHIPTQIPNTKAKQVSVGKEHTVLIDLGNNAWSFGSDEYGVLGLGNIPTLSIGLPRLIKRNNYQDKSTPILIPNLKVIQVSAGSYNTIILGTFIRED